MDATLLLNEAVDLLISKIGTDKELTNVLIDFSLDKADDDKSWDISRELNEFSKILLNEDDTKHFRKLADKKLADFTHLKTKLFTYQKEIKKRLQEIGNRGLQVIENEQLNHKDFYRSMLPNHFLALAQNPYKAKFFEDSKLRERIYEYHFYAKSKSDAIKNTIEGILPALLDLYTESEKLYQQFLVNKLALKSIVPLAVLNHINVELTSIKEENNIRLNAEFNQLISDTIKDQPAPFIYERIGEKFKHFSIMFSMNSTTLRCPSRNAVSYGSAEKVGEWQWNRERRSSRTVSPSVSPNRKAYASRKSLICLLIYLSCISFIIGAAAPMASAVCICSCCCASCCI